MIFRSPWRGRRGVALIIVLAFVVLLTGLIIALFSRSLLDRQISNSSASQAKVSAFADGAADAIIGELKQEIVLSSSATAMTSGTAGTLTSGTLYTPLAAALTGSSAGMLPQMTGLNGLAWAPAPNLLKISGSGQLFYSGTNVSGSAVTIPLSGVSNVIAVSSTIPSLNGRYISPARWNAHYLLPLLSSTDSTPVMTGTGAFIPPYWVLVARDGSNPAPATLSSTMTASGSNPVVGRYAFAIYHEGGLLDANVAGYPSTTGSNQFGYKPALAYADLTRIGLASSQIDQLVAWRNYASAQTPGSFSSPNFASVPASGSNYYTNVVISNSTGFLSVSGTVYNGQTDQMFASRQELIKFVQSGLGISGTSLNVLNYLTHFTRDLNQPSINPNPLLPKIVGGIGTAGATPPYSDYAGGNNGYGYDATINPPFLSQAVAPNATWTRNDGTPAVAGEPLVKKRFALDRLAWITCRGPIASGTFVGTATTAAQVSGTDPVLINLAQTLHDSYGLSFPFLQQGTATNIRNYFGLVWQTTSAYSGLIAPNYWVYAPGSYGTAVSTTPVQGHINNPDEITNREPNFIELLKAAIHAGALGKATGNPVGTTYEFETSDGGSIALRDYIVLKDSSIDCQVMQLAANIIDQAGLDAFPKRIIFDDGSLAPTANPRLFTGVEDLPYLYRTLNVPIYARKPNIMGKSTITASNYFGGYPVSPEASGALTDAGAGALLIFPEVWNPHDQNGLIAGGVPAGGTTTLRPNPTQNGGLYLRVVADNTDPVTALFGLNGAANATPVNSLDIDPPTTNANSNPGTPTNVNGPYVLNPTTSELDFGDNNGVLFREPTALCTPNIPIGSGLTTGTGHWLRTDGLLKSAGASGYLTDFRMAALYPSTPQYDNYLGIYMGSFPLAAFSGPATTGTVSYYGWNLSGGPCYEVYHNQPELTFRMQCKDAYNNWIDYDVKAWANIQTQNNRYAGAYYDSGTGLQELVGCTTGNKNTGVSSVVDPRTDRFGVQVAYNNTWVAVQSLDPNGNAVSYNTWAQNSNVVGTKLPLYSKPNNNAHPPLLSVYTPPPGAGFTGGADDGLYSQNIAGKDVVSGTNYYSDADGIVRNGMAAYWTSQNVGLPTSTASGTTWATGPTTPIAQSQSRPMILHRPFKNVAELGYVFSDTPWKNIDFFTPQSGNNALLDLFCTHDPTSNNPLVAGKVNLNTRQPLVLQAVLAGAYRDEVANLASPPAYSLPALSANEAQAIATALVARTTGTAAGTGPLTNIGDLVGVPVTSGSFVGLSGTDLTAVFNSSDGASTAASVVQRMREAAIRPLAQVGSTRVWNLMIDVMAQTGRYPLSATSASIPLAAFLVEGEQHYWIHIAIDRATGQVLDKQVEVVKE